MSVELNWFVTVEVMTPQEDGQFKSEFFVFGDNEGPSPIKAVSLTQAEERAFAQTCGLMAKPAHTMRIQECWTLQE